MAKKTYGELLKDPRWQKKRLRILERDKFKCRSCESDYQTLHVHHLRYDYDIAPWDSDDEDLITLCEDCHQALHYIEKHPSLGMETFLCVLSLYQRIEFDAIDKFLNDHE